MISISPSAAHHLQRMIEEHHKPPNECADLGAQDSALSERRLGLRILVEKGGCAGMQYIMKIDSENPGDVLIEKGGGKVLLDPESAKFLGGSELDYCEDLVGTGFRLNNPKAARSCGCGTSFEPLPEEAVPASGHGGA